MSNKVTINGNEYSYGDIVESEFFDDISKEIVLNGEVVKVGDVWLTRELNEVLITSINIGCWPIGDNKERTYSVYGIADCSYEISGQDLMTKYVKDIPYTEDTENVEDAEVPKNTEEPKNTEDVTYADNGIDNLPILDIQIGDVWETSEGKKVEIASTLSGSNFVWFSTEGLSYTNRGTYFSSMISPTKDLVLRVSRTTEIKEATEINEATEIKEVAELNEAPALDMPSNYAEATEIKEALVPEEYSHFEDALRYSTISVKEDFTYEFTNTIARLVHIVAQEMKDKAVYKDINEVKRLTKVLEKVIALESL